jgi:hypothetical protein
MAFNKDEFLEKVGDLAEDASVKAASLLERLKPTMTTAARRLARSLRPQCPMWRRPSRPRSRLPVRLWKQSRPS